MIWSLAAVIVVIVLLVRTRELTLVGAVVRIISVALAWALLLILLRGIPPFGYTTEPTAVEAITSVGRTSGTEGSFTLGSGNIKTKIVYYYYARQPDGTLKLKSVDAEDSVIREVTTEPVIQTYGPNLLSQLLLSSTESRYELDVPVGSVIQQFNP